MRKVLRGYAEDKTGKLILIGTMPVPVRTKDIWSGKTQRSSRKKQLANPSHFECVWRCLKASSSAHSALFSWTGQRPLGIRESG
jgi:hypothetical protein